MKRYDIGDIVILKEYHLKAFIQGQEEYSIRGTRGMIHYSCTVNTKHYYEIKFMVGKITVFIVVSHNMIMKYEEI